jgi:hypothetical protein
MKDIEIVAKTGSKEKGNVTEIKGKATQYESLKEAIAAMKGEDKVLALINAQLKTDAMNALRRPKSETTAIAKGLESLKARDPKKYEEARKLLALQGITI